MECTLQAPHPFPHAWWLGGLSQLPAPASVPFHEPYDESEVAYGPHLQTSFPRAWMCHSEYLCRLMCVLGLGRGCYSLRDKKWQEEEIGRPELKASLEHMRPFQNLSPCPQRGKYTE